MAKEMPKSSIQISGLKLKEVLQRFPHHTPLLLLELADTWHPDSGFVDEQHFSSHQVIADWLNESYDFKGLIRFQAQLGAFEILLDGDGFIIHGNSHEIEGLKYGPFFDVLA